MRFNKKILALLTVASIGFSLVACSAEKENEPVTTGEGTKVEDSKVEAEEKTEEANTEEAKVEETPKQEEVVLVDDETAKIIVTEKAMDELFGAGYKVSIENKSDKKIIVQSRDMSIDGTMSEPIFSVEVTAGKKANGDMIFMDIKTLEDLKNLEGKVVVLDENFAEVSSYDVTLE